MRNFLSVLGKLAAAAAVLAGILAVIYRIKKDKDDENRLLDEYLMGDEDDSPVQTFYVQESNPDLLHEDAEEWEQLPEDERVTVSFKVLPDSSRKFQENLAGLGVSSSYDEENAIMDIYLYGPMSREDLLEVADELQKAAENADVEYQGFAFE